MSENTKVCTICKEEKELNTENFIYRKNGDYWEGKCRECQNEIRRKNREKKQGIEYTEKEKYKVEKRNLVLKKSIL